MIRCESPHHYAFTYGWGIFPASAGTPSTRHIQFLFDKLKELFLIDKTIKKKLNVSFVNFVKKILHVHVLLQIVFQLMLMLMKRQLKMLVKKRLKLIAFLQKVKEQLKHILIHMVEVPGQQFL